ncbi:MAG: glycerophosphodiester phosphodiesterase [Bacteroidetes bacterium]|nr:MAG: glycerophosphodiester phosphodiesterase [Bacteroidota bacterium]
MKKYFLLLPFLLGPIGLLAQSGQEISFVGHRGASYLAPENTQASISLAWELGADAAECDIMLSSDQQVLLFHDKNTKKLTGSSYEVAETPWSVLKELRILPKDSHRKGYEKETIPLLSTILSDLPDKRMLVIEIKTGPEIIPHLKPILEKYWKRGEISFISFNLESVLEAKANWPKVPCYYLSMFKKDLKKQLPVLVAHHIDGVDLRHSMIDVEVMKECTEAGMEVWCWTVNDPAVALKMKNLGVTAITTDRPAWLREHL